MDDLKASLGKVFVQAAIGNYQYTEFVEAYIHKYIHMTFSVHSRQSVLVKRLCSKMYYVSVLKQINSPIKRTSRKLLDEGCFYSELLSQPAHGEITCFYIKAQIQFRQDHYCQMKVVISICSHLYLLLGCTVCTCPFITAAKANKTIT